MPDLRKPTPFNITTQTGASRFPFLLLLAFTAAIAYLVAVFVPAYMGKQRMEEAANEIVHRGAVQNLSESEVRAQLHEKAREFGLPDDHRIELSRNGKAMMARISFTHLVRFPFYTYHWPVEIRVKDLGF
jgi:hypothetical protein